MVKKTSSWFARLPIELVNMIFAMAVISAYIFGHLSSGIVGTPNRPSLSVSYARNEGPWCQV
jgi:hypothetical protein